MSVSQELRNCLGYVQNGTSTTVTLSQDDATYDFVVRVGKRSYSDRNLDEAINKAAQDNQPED
jgi:hypothetical protein